MFTPATAKGYSHTARIPCCFSINLLKGACLIVGSPTSNRQFICMSRWTLCSLSKELILYTRSMNPDFIYIILVSGIYIYYRKGHTGYVLAKNKRFSSEINPQPLKPKSNDIVKLFVCPARKVCFVCWNKPVADCGLLRRKRQGAFKFTV